MKYIFLYLKRVEFIVSRFKLAFGKIDYLEAYHSRDLPKEGYLDIEKIYQYNFHGIGCEVKILNTGEIVDFDFGPEGQTNGFDAWKVWIYIRSLNLEEEVSLSEMRELFKELGNSGKILTPKVHKLDSNLCYLPAHAGSVRR